MDSVKLFEGVKFIVLVAILVVYNIVAGFTSSGLVFSAVIFVFFVISEFAAVAILRGRIRFLVRGISELRQSRDLKRHMERCKISDFDLITSQFNALIDDLHSVIGRSVNTASQIAHDTEEITKFSQATFEGLDETSRQIQEVSSVLNEFSETINDISRGIQMAADSARVASETTAEEGDRISSQIVSKLESIIGSVNATQSAIKELEKNADYITDIMALIQNIADQINLLALNAAIEAARAGEAGRGFAVVADEVRKLSEKTVQTTQNIESVTDNLRAQIRDSASLMDSTVEKVGSISEIAEEVTQALSRIGEGSEKVYRAVEQMASAVEEQSSSIISISENVKNIEKVYEEVKTNASKTASSVNEFNRLSKELLEEIGEFKLRMFGVVPLENAVTMNKKFSGLVSYLNKRLNTNYIIHVAKDYESAIEEIGTGKTELAYLTPTVYIEAKHKYGVRLLGCFQKGTSATFRSVLVTSKDSGIKSVSDLKGKKVAFGSKKSTGSTLIPMAILIDSGVSLNDLAKYDFLGAHDKVAEAVIKGEFDAGGMTEGILDEFKDKGLVAIKVSDPIPQYPVCVSPFVDDEMIERIKKALFELDDPAVLNAMSKGYTRFVEIEDSAFDIVRRIVKQIYGKDFS